MFCKVSCYSYSINRAQTAQKENDMKFYSVFIKFDNCMRNAADFFMGMYRHYGSKEEAEKAKAEAEAALAEAKRIREEAAKTQDGEVTEKHE